MKTFKNSRLAQNTVGKGEKPVGKTLTVPKQSLSIRQIIARMSTGQSVPYAQPIYYDPVGVSVPDPTLDPAFDYTDAQQLVDAANDERRRREEEAELNNDNSNTVKELSLTESGDNSVAESGNEKVMPKSMPK